MLKLKIKVGLVVMMVAVGISGCASSENNAEKMLTNDFVPFSNGPTEEPFVAGPNEQPPTVSDVVKLEVNKENVVEVLEAPKAMTSKEDIVITLPEEN